MRTASCTATTSLPSACSTVIPAANPFCASVSLAVCFASGVEIAHRLLVITNTTGSRQTPARLNASYTSPFEVAASPNTHTTARASPRYCIAYAAPAACSAWPPTVMEVGKSCAGPAQSLPRSLPA